MKSTVSSVAWPFLKIADVAQDKAHGVVQFLSDQQLLRRQNEALRSQAGQMAAVALQMAELQSENQRLQALLQFKGAQIPPTIAARVMGYDPSGWTQSVLIDKGTSDGIAASQAVIASAGVVGRIAESSTFSSKVLLLIDSHMRMGAMLENSREAGILEGLGPGQCRVLYLPKDSVIALGQSVITSGLGGIFPKGLMIGKVTAVGLDELGLYQYAEVQPAVPIAKLEEVLVLKNIADVEAGKP